MSLKIIIFLATVVNALVVDKEVPNFIKDDSGNISDDKNKTDLDNLNEDNAASVFNGVYTECFLYLSYFCLQKKTLLYLKELNKLSEVSVIGEYVKFVKINETENEEMDAENNAVIDTSEELSFRIDRAVDKFFNNHVLKFKALGRDISMPQTVEEFVGRKRKGGGGGGGGGGHGGGGGDGGKKKMMMMAMMCMKMKLMMMVPAMMGMMGMMSFKGMMFSMMSFMVSKMMLLMKILEKKGGGGGGGGGGDGGWAAGGGGGGGAWMPAGGQDYGGGGGGGGGYDANGQWQGRSNDDVTGYAYTEPIGEAEGPITSYVKPFARHNHKISERKSYSSLKAINDEVIKLNQNHAKSRKKRGITDILQGAYVYWLNQLLNLTRNRRLQPKTPKYRIINGVKYVYYPLRQLPKPKAPKLLPQIEVKPTETPIITAEDFNKGEIVDSPVESRMTKKLQTFKDDLNEVIEENPWE